LRKEDSRGSEIGWKHVFCRGKKGADSFLRGGRNLERQVGKAAVCLDVWAEQNRTSVGEKDNYATWSGRFDPGVKKKPSRF